MYYHISSVYISIELINLGVYSEIIAQKMHSNLQHMVRVEFVCMHCVQAMQHHKMDEDKIILSDYTQGHIQIKMPVNVIYGKHM